MPAAFTSLPHIIKVRGVTQLVFKARVGPSQQMYPCICLPLNRGEALPAFFALAGVAHAHRRLVIVGG